MKTLQSKICSAALVLACSAFGVDRWVLGGGSDQPASASAYAVVADKSAGPGKPSPAPMEPLRTPAGRSLAARLQAVSDANHLTRAAVADAFAPSPQFLPPVAPKPIVRDVVPIAVDLGAPFIARHRLVAVMKSSRGGVAIIQGRVLKPGQKIDGFTLLSVGDNSAILSNGSSKVELKIHPQL